MTLIPQTVTRTVAESDEATERKFTPVLGEHANQ
jgi:hypothetical protein